MAGKTWKLPPLAQKPKFVEPKVEFQSGGVDSDVFYSFSGAEAVMENVKLLAAFDKDAAGFELAQILHEVIVDAKENYVPYRLGHLHDSGDSDEYIPGKMEEVIELGAWFAAPGSGISSGEATRTAAEVAEAGLTEVDPSKYALIQHEDLTFNHTIGGPKYLERPFLAKIPQILPRIAEAVGRTHDMNPAFVKFALSEDNGS